MNTSKWTTCGLFTSLFLFSATSALSAQYDATEYEALTAQAQRDGFVRVLIALGNYRLPEIGEDGDAIRAETESGARAVLAELGENALIGGYSNNGIGQMRVNVNEEGLRILAGSKSAVAFMRDVSYALRIKAVDLDGSIDEIESRFVTDSAVEVEIFLNVDAVDYDIDVAGTTVFRAQPALSQQLDQGLRNILSKPYGGSIDVLEVEKDSPSLRAIIDRSAFYGLIESGDVRAVRPVGFEDARKSQLPEDVLEIARAQGKVGVAISLRGGDFFSPKTGYMSNAGMDVQAKANERAFANIFSRAGLAPPVQENGGGYLLGGLATQLSFEEVRKLYENADPRILSITADFATPAALATSTAQMNLANAWALGYTAAGQHIIIIDSGIRQDHSFFEEPTTPFTKVRNEACFGTNGTVGGITYVSICPNQDGVGDSPLNEPNAGEPYNNATTCAALLGLNCGHGTHVAGIAAGNTPAGYSPHWQGVAPDAKLVAVQIMSYRDSPAVQNAISTDINQALTVVHNNTVAGTYNNLTVNMSLGGGVYDDDCDWFNTDTTARVHDLVSRGVPVVVSTGNFGNGATGSRTGISWPSCISQVVKVSGVENDLTGTTIFGNGNYSNPADYTGPFWLAPSGGGSTSVISAYHTSTTAGFAASGTSMAAPHATGVYAALKAAVPGITVADATDWIQTYGSIQVTLDLGAPHGNINFRRLRMPF